MIQPVSEIIRRRRAVFPKFYITGKPVDAALLEELLENANWAPTHRLTEPWRFQVFHSPESREKLGAMLAEYYRNNTPPEQFSEEKMTKNSENPSKSGAVIALILHRDAEARVPEWEEIASVAMAVQNMWLTCAEMGLGCYWSTPGAALKSPGFFNLQEGERCLGLFYIGWPQEGLALPGKRQPVAEKTMWR